MLLKAIDDAFASLGESPKTAIYLHLENAFRINRKEIPDHIEDFSNALYQIFGLGASHLEILIMKNLHDKSSTEQKWNTPSWLIPDLTFCKYVAIKKLAYENPVKIEFEVLFDAEEKQEQKTRKSKNSFR